MPFTLSSLILATVSGLAFTDPSQSQLPDLASLLQQPSVLARSGPAKEPVLPKSEPFLIGLRRESVPVYRRGKVASFKTSYSGVLNVGTPAQEFRVVFDTGSGNIVLPAAECKSEACLVPDRRRFNMAASSTAVAVNQDGSEVPANENCDQVTIGFGTGEITGEFTRDRVCFGSPSAKQSAELSDSTASEGNDLCVEMNVIVAVEMSTQPFKTFRFDGILGLGLDSLAMNANFSAFQQLMGTGLPASHFGVFLSEGEEDGEESEIAMGGVDSKRLLEPLSWAPVSMPELGYWQIPIKAVRINGQLLDVCRDGTCRGVVDTGTSHLGIPAPYDKDFARLLTREAGETLDCRLIDAPEVEFELEDFKLTLHAANYMRRLPLRDGVSVSSTQGVYIPSNESNATLKKPSSADPVGMVVANVSGVNATNTTGGNGSAAVLAEADVKRFCSPRLMPVRLPEPLGPKLFILGEPVLHRYYTVYDWTNHRVGFSLANNRRNTMDPSAITDRRGVLPKEVDMLLMQERVAVKREGRSRLAQSPADDQAEVQEEVAMVQVTVMLSVRTRRV